MRDAIGGTFMIEMLMIFIVLFVSFTAVIVNVANKFRIKNAVVNYVEQYDYDGTVTEGGAITQIDNYLDNAEYSISIYSTLWTEAKAKCEASSQNAKWFDRGYCISKQGKTGSEYYKVTVYVYIDLPFFKYHLSLPISGESKTVQSLN